MQIGVRQGSALGSLPFLLYINDLNKFNDHSRDYHFADNTDILLSNESFELLHTKNGPRYQKSLAMVKSKQTFSAF